MIRPCPPARSLAAAFAPLAFVLGLAGCAGDSQPIATVGSTVVTRADYLSAAAGASAQYPPDAEPAKMLLLEDLVRRRLLVLAGRQRGMFDDTVVVNYRRAREEELLIQALGRELTPAGATVSEAEMRQLYAWRDSSVRVQVIYAFTREMAQSATREARETGDFTAVANRINPAGAIPPGGDLGFQAPGNLLSPLDHYVRTAAPGTIVGPLESPGQGWFVMRVGERRQTPQPPFDDIRRQLSDMIRQRKHRASIFRAVRHLREIYALRVVPGAPQLLFAHLNLPEGAPHSYSPEELARPVARWETTAGVHDYTFADAIADLAIPNRDKPDPLVVPSIEQWIIGEAGRRLQVLEARRRALDADPAFRRQVDETVNNFVLEGLYGQEVMSQVTLQPTDVLEVYERNRSRYERIEGVTTQVVDFPDSASANAFTAHSGHGGDLHAAAAMVPGAPPVRDLTVRFPNPDPEWQQLEQPLAAMGAGDAVGPFPIRDGWRIVMVLLKQTRVTSFEELDASQRGMLEQEGMELARERRLMSWVEDLRREFPVAVDSTRVRKLPWPVEPAGS